MSKVPKPVPPRDVEVDVRLGELRAEFADWVFQYLGLTVLPWEASRRPYRHPVSGGFSWIRAASAERLRELVAAAERIEAQG